MCSLNLCLFYYIYNLKSKSYLESKLHLPIAIVFLMISLEHHQVLFKFVFILLYLQFEVQIIFKMYATWATHDFFLMISFEHHQTHLSYP